MGDISESRILILVATFIGIFAFIIVLMPQPLLPSSERDVASVSYPDGWESHDLLYIAESYNTTVTNSTDIQFEFGGRSMRLTGSYSANGHSVILYEYWFEWLVMYRLEPCDWLDSTGYYYDANFQNALLMESLDNSSYTQDERFIGRWTEHSQFKVYIIFSFDTGTYSGWEDAMSKGGLSIWLGIQFDQVNTSYNAWDIVGMILFFRMPDIDPILNAILAVPFWVAVAYVSFILVLRAIGSVFGGGGA